MNMKLKKVLDDIQKTEEKIAELQKHLKKQNDLKQQMVHRNYQIFPFTEAGQQGTSCTA